MFLCLLEGLDLPIIHCNSAFTRLTGYTFEEMEDRSFGFLLGEHASFQEMARLRETLAAEEFYQGILLCFRKDGTAFWSELTLNPVRYKNDEFFVVGVLRDISERIELEARLGTAQRFEAIGKLSGGVAHDFNNLLALILGNAELILRESGESSKIGDAARDIVQAARGGADLIRQMLKYSRGSERGSGGFALNKTINEIAELLKRSMIQPVTIETRLDPSIGSVRVDRALFNTALINLLLNARDALEQPGSITIRTSLQAAGCGTAAGNVEVSVTDDGIGMSDEVIERALDPFFTTKGAGKGNGLGLPMVDSFVQQSGGKLSIVSAVGKGTTVTMVLPYAVD